MKLLLNRLMLGASLFAFSFSLLTTDPVAITGWTMAVMQLIRIDRVLDT